MHAPGCTPCGSSAVVLDQMLHFTVCLVKRSLYLPQADPVTWAGVKPSAAEQQPPAESTAAAGVLANGRAHSGSLRGSTAVQRSSSNNLAATAIS